MNFKNEETRIQVAVANWLKLVHPKVCFTISPSGMKLPIWIAMMLKAMGYRSGTPDLLIFEPRGGYFGLFVELKTEKGVTSANQKEMLNELEARGYKAAVCFGYEVAIQFIDKYLALGKSYQS